MDTFDIQLYNGAYYDKTCWRGTYGKMRVEKSLPTRYRPLKGRRCIPDVAILVHVETYLNVDLNSSAQVKIQFQTLI